MHQYASDAGAHECMLAEDDDPMRTWMVQLHQAGTLYAEDSQIRHKGTLR